MIQTQAKWVVYLKENNLQTENNFFCNYSNELNNNSTSNNYVYIILRLTIASVKVFFSSVNELA